MLYPRTTKTGKLISLEQMVDTGEHLLSRHRVLFLDGAILGNIELPARLMALDSLSHEPIKLIITSPGGDLDATFLLYDTIKLLKSPFYTYGRFCASAAVLILASGDKRYLSPHTRTVLHLPMQYFQKESLVPIQDMEILQREFKKCKDKMIDLLIECGAKKKKQEILRDIDRDFWLEPKEVIKYGLADEVITEDIMGGWLT